LLCLLAPLWLALSALLWVSLLAPLWGPQRDLDKARSSSLSPHGTISLLLTQMCPHSRLALVPKFFTAGTTGSSGGAVNRNRYSRVSSRTKLIVHWFVSNLSYLATRPYNLPVDCTYSTEGGIVILCVAYAAISIS